MSPEYPASNDVDPLIGTSKYGPYFGQRVPACPSILSMTAIVDEGQSGIFCYAASDLAIRFCDQCNSLLSPDADGEELARYWELDALDEDAHQLQSNQAWLQGELAAVSLAGKPVAYLLHQCESAKTFLEFLAADADASDAATAK